MLCGCAANPAPVEAIGDAGNPQARIRIDRNGKHGSKRKAGEREIRSGLAGDQRENSEGENAAGQVLLYTFCQGTGPAFPP